MELHARDFGVALVPHVLDVAVSRVGDLAEAVQRSRVGLERVGRACERAIGDSGTNCRFDGRSGLRRASLLLRGRTSWKCYGYCCQKDCWPVLAHISPEGG